MANYFLLIDGSGGYLNIDGSGGKLIISVDSDSVGDGRSHFTYYDRQHEFKEAKKREEIKQNEVVEMRLKAQEALLQIREANKEKGRAAKLRADKLQQEYDLLLKEISMQMAALELMRIATEQKRRNLIYLLLAASQPFSQITIH